MNESSLCALEAALCGKHVHQPIENMVADEAAG